MRSMGFDPVRWLVVPRCLALVVVVPLLTWVGDVLALVGGFVATTAITDMTPRAYVMATADAITAEPSSSAGLVKTPVSGARDRADRLRPGAGHAGRRRRGRRAHDDRRGAGDLRRDRDQRRCSRFFYALMGI